MAADRDEFRRPESVLVVVHTPGLECLLLERVSPPGFWQSVTGALAQGEGPRGAAVREVFEETGLAADGLVPTGTTNRFPILPAWRERYAPGVTENEEHLFYLCVDTAVAVALNPAEHRRSVWLPARQAAATVTSSTNRDAILRLLSS